MHRRKPRQRTEVTSTLMKTFRSVLSWFGFGVNVIMGCLRRFINIPTCILGRGILFSSLSLSRADLIA